MDGVLEPRERALLEFLHQLFDVDRPLVTTALVEAELCTDGHHQAHDHRSPFLVEFVILFAVVEEHRVLVESHDRVIAFSEEPEGHVLVQIPAFERYTGPFAHSRLF